jgi:hypothetical protein
MHKLVFVNDTSFPSATTHSFNVQNQFQYVVVLPTSLAGTIAAALAMTPSNVSGSRWFTSYSNVLRAHKTSQNKLYGFPHTLTFLL